LAWLGLAWLMPLIHKEAAQYLFDALRKNASISLTYGCLPVRKKQIANSWANIYRAQCWPVILKTEAYLLVRDAV